MADVFICRKGDLTPKSIRDLRAAGIVVVEATDPSACAFIKATETVSSNDMLWAAMKALQVDDGLNGRGGAQRKNFAENIWELVDTDFKKRTDK